MFRKDRQIFPGDAEPNYKKISSLRANFIEEVGCAQKIWDYVMVFSRNKVVQFARGIKFNDQYDLDNVAVHV